MELKIIRAWKNSGHKFFISLAYQIQIRSCKSYDMHNVSFPLNLGVTSMPSIGDFLIFHEIKRMKSIGLFHNLVGKIKTEFFLF